MEFNTISDEKAMGKCTWCQKHIGDDMEVFAAGAKLKTDVDLSEYEGHCIQIGLVSEEKPIYMMVTAQDSEAKKEGKDGMFLLCSEECGKKLKNVLAKEISIGKMFGTVYFE